MKKTGKRNRESEWITRMSAYRPEDVEKLMVYAAMKRKEKAVREKRKNE